MFEMTSSVNNHSGSPYQSQDEVQSAVFRFATDSTGMVMGNFNLPYKVTCQTQTMFNDPEVKEVMNLVMLAKEWRDSSLGFRY